jgi:hypothetical protein
MKIPNRGDKQYTDIEKFKKYELTHCIAYEMAIRNDEVIDTIHSFVNNFIKHDRYLYKYQDYKKCYDDSQKLLESFIAPNELYLKYHFFNELNKIIADIQSEERENKKLFEKIELEASKTKLNNNYIDEFFYNEVKKNIDEDSEEAINNKIRDLKHTQSISNILLKPHKDIYFKQDFGESQTRPNTFIEEEKTKLYYSLIVHHKEENSVSVAHNDISPIYQRPLYLDFKDRKERNIILNMSLSEDELVDFIKRLKSKQKFKKSMFKTVFELTNDEEIHSNSTLDDYKDNIRVPNVQSNYSNMFYCYDCYKLGIDEKEIKGKIQSFRQSKGDYSEIKKSTIQKYIEHGINYIDKKMYKQLFT